MVIRPSTSPQSQINRKEELEREETAVFEVCMSRGNSTRKKTLKDLPVWPARLLTGSCNRKRNWERDSGVKSYTPPQNCHLNLDT